MNKHSIISDSISVLVFPKQGTAVASLMLCSSCLPAFSLELMTEGGHWVSVNFICQSNRQFSTITKFKWSFTKSDKRQTTLGPLMSWLHFKRGPQTLYGQRPMCVSVRLKCHDRHCQPWFCAKQSPTADSESQSEGHLKQQTDTSGSRKRIYESSCQNQKGTK